jgi:drug/metabolite transporter (DMT)-like permease
LLAFAANSILCRTALGGAAIDAGSFTWVRLASGAAMLALVTAMPFLRGSAARAPSGGRGPGGQWGAHTAWTASVALLSYAAAFSFAYLRLPAGTGALVLFAATQLTMIGGGMIGGHRPSPREWLGVGIAVAGLVALTARGATAPDLLGVSLMALAGLGWGVYSMLGRKAADPVAANGAAFLRAAVVSTALVLLPLSAARIATARGVTLAVVSGAVTSGLGYCLWYRALPHLTPVRASVLQLTVPVITAVAGALLLGEAVTLRLVAAGSVILGGVALVMLEARAPARRAPAES